MPICPDQVNPVETYDDGLEFNYPRDGPQPHEEAHRSHLYHRRCHEYYRRWRKARGKDIEVGGLVKIYDDNSSPHTPEVRQALRDLRFVSVQISVSTNVTFPTLTHFCNIIEHVDPKRFSTATETNRTRTCTYKLAATGTTSDDKSDDRGDGCPFLSRVRIMLPWSGSSRGGDWRSRPRGTRICSRTRV